MNLSVRRIAEFVCANVDHFAVPDSSVSGYSIDSRSLRIGDLFFAVKGERLDGHDYVAAALKSGASACVVSKARAHDFADHSRLLVVDDPLKALHALAHAVRRLWGKPIVGITGSAGKTTTKEMTANLLSTRFNVLKSEGNLNNHFGLPLQLLRLEPHHQIAVIELGMSNAGEIATLAKIASPDTGVVTCVAPVHLENFSSVAAIARAKYELIQSLPAGGVAILNADDCYVSHFGRDFHGKVITFGIEARQSDVRAEAVQDLGEHGSKFLLVNGSSREPVTLPLFGKHNVLNALAASAVAIFYGVALEECARALGSIQASGKRGETLLVAGATIINDCYNSNPLALKAMMDVLHGFSGKRKIVVAGEMLELGPATAELHRECGMYAKGIADIVIGVRGAAWHIVEAAKELGVATLFFETPIEAGKWLADELHPDDVVLFKGSRGVKMETAIDVLEKEVRSRT